MPNPVAENEVLLAGDERKSDRYPVEIIIYSQPEWIIIGGGNDIPRDFTLGDIEARNRQFVEILEDLRTTVQLSGIDLSGHRHDFLRQLRGVGVAAYNRLVSRKFRESLTHIQVEEQKDLSLTFKTTPELSFLWEMIYSSGRRGPIDPNGFWGYRYPIGRAYRLEGFHFPSEIEPGTGIFSAIHEGLDYSKDEVEHLREFVTQVKKKFGLTQLDVELLEHLISADDLMERFISQEFGYGLIHFACHCENPEQTPASEASLSLKAGDQEVEIRLQTLEEWEGEGGFLKRPFVFLNACGSSTLGHFLETTNFPAGFMRLRAGGVIATACTVPDNFAAAFASEFYKRLLKLHTESEENPELGPDDLSSNIGEALRETRVFFLEEYNNPLGLAYGLYSLSNQRLRLADNPPLRRGRPRVL